MIALRFAQSLNLVAQLLTNGSPLFNPGLDSAALQTYRRYSCRTLLKNYEPATVNFRGCVRRRRVLKEALKLELISPLISPVKTVPAAVIKYPQYQVPAVPVTSRQLFAAGTAAGTIEFSQLSIQPQPQSFQFSQT
jgi:hypothetical protein